MAVAQLLSDNPLVLYTIIILFLLVVVAYQRKAQHSSLPPGPPGEPILGHLRIIPTDNPEYYYMRVSREYGSDILSFNVLGQSVIVLNSVQAATDLLDKRGANYCDRPRFVLFEIMGWHKTLTFLRWGPSFRMHRRILQKNFQKSNIGRYRYLQERETIVLLRGIMDRPAVWETVLRRFSTAIALGVGFGIKIETDNEPLVQVAADASYALGHGGAPAGTPVDFFPLMRFLPGFLHDRSLRFANHWRFAIVNLRNEPYETILASKPRVQSLVQDMLDQQQSQVTQGQAPEISEEDIKGAGAAVFAAGQDTTWSTLVVFILNMVLHPEVQSKAQRDLDKVVGRDRLPTFDDRPNLPYIDFIVQETFRWCPVSPMGVPHRSLKDDVYGAFFIPAGSFVYANARAMTHDERIYKNPNEFEPDRYAPLEGGGRGEPFPRGQFGFGRRICIGKHFAEATVWIVVAVMLSTMSIETEKDANGTELLPVVELTNGLTSHPKSFPCRIRPRDEKSATVVRDAQLSSI
ncbi:Cytochrome P450 1A1 [Trichoderma ghanense]|uniref:Cytochrome P450 1A1 n=1 Tax=Trichoderma ghanense TaxID=65468 RepID=A0ABY2H1P6_9HYPO